MVQWRKLLGLDERYRARYRDEIRQLLPRNNEETTLHAIPPAVVTKVALRLKYQIEQVIPYQLEEDKVLKANSPVITRQVIQTAREAGGQKYGACVVFCLLICQRWFKRQALIELWDADLHQLRSKACEWVAKYIIEDEDDQTYLIHHVLLQRFSLVVNGQISEPANAVERAVDLHALNVIGSSGYQKCISHLWRGWLVQDDESPPKFVAYREKANTAYWSHFDPDRMRAPQYQNAVQIFFSILYLALYTGAINTINQSGDLDVVEGILYIMTAGFLFDEISKLWKVGRYYIGFWNVFNSTLYALLIVSFILRFVALGHDADTRSRWHFNELSYNLLAFSAPMFWMRLLLYLDTLRFFGAMLVVLKVMMKESLIFFALLLIVMVGFLQAFIGMDQADDNSRITSFIIKAMANSVLQSPDFEGFGNFAPPFGIILYYIFTFVVMVVLLNILIALYNSAYEDITDNALDEYMALFSQKTLQFVRAPDENVFLPPFNLIEIFCLIIPLEWWMSRERYERLNNHIMALLYSPLLLITAWVETRQALKIKENRRHGEEDDDVVEEWEAALGNHMEREAALVLTSDMDGEDEDQVAGGAEVADGAQSATSNKRRSQSRQTWADKVEATKPNIKTDLAVVEIRECRKEVEQLRGMIEALRREVAK